MMDDHLTVDKTKSKYWIYFSHYPCHHDLPNDAEKEALTMLQLMVVRKRIHLIWILLHSYLSLPENLANLEGMARTPFSMPDIQRYIDFFNFSKTLEASDNDVPSAKGFVISNIIANFCASLTPYIIPQTKVDLNMPERPMVPVVPIGGRCSSLLLAGVCLLITYDASTLRTTCTDGRFNRTRGNHFWT